MYAVVEDRNQQFRAAPGERVRIALQADLEPGSSMTFDKVCLIGGDGADGAEGRIGTPYVDGATVTAKVVGEVKGPKLVVQKLRRRKNSRRKTGFRARFTEVEIESINA